MTISSNEVTIFWNEVTVRWNEMTWNEVTMERSDRNKIHATRQRARAGNSTICYRKKSN